MHEGHRNRLVSKVSGGGIVYEHELLEILLFSACPRKDLNATAHALISRCGGSLLNVLNADCGDLAKVEGVGENIAEYVAVLGKALSAVKKVKCFAQVSNLKQFKEFISARPSPKTDVLELYCIDKNGGVCRVYTFKADGGLRVQPSENQLLKALSVYHPYGLFVADRRAHGSYPPDLVNDSVAERVAKTAKLCGVKLYDYCVVGDDGEIYSYKMADRTVFGAAGNANG